MRPPHAPLLDLLTLVALGLSQTVWAQPIVDTDFLEKAADRDALLRENPEHGAGIDPARDLVVYGQRGATSAYFALLTLQHFGATQASVDHDGIDAWRAAGLPLSTATTANAALKRPGVQVIDVRTPKEFSGEDIRALRGGHIPGARSIPYEQNWGDPDSAAKMRRGEVKDTLGMGLKPAGDLQRLYTGLNPAPETIVYCNSGVRAAETAVVLKQLGFKDVKVYDPSWIGWANNLKPPVESETFFNIGRGWAACNPASTASSANWPTRSNLSSDFPCATQRGGGATPACFTQSEQSP